jgi:chaperone modulatory protein CbpM
MMMRFEMVVAEFPDVDAPELSDWIARGWVVPEGSTRADWAFAEIDVARIRLIRDLRLRMALEEDALTLVLSLLDQVYGLRGALHAMLRALEDQPPAVRQAVLTTIGGLSS